VYNAGMKFFYQETSLEKFPEWLPNPKLRSQLSSKTISLNKFSLCLPRDYSVMKLSMQVPKGMEMFVYVNKKRPEGERPSIILLTLPKEDMSLSNSMINFVAGIRDKKEVNAWRQSKIEYGKIAGQVFARLYWQGVDPQKTSPLRGLIYISQTKDGSLCISAQDTLAGAQQSFPVIETAIFTLKKSP
jgi:hypothetical protein